MATEQEFPPVEQVAKHVHSVWKDMQVARRQRMDSDVARDYADLEASLKEELHGLVEAVYAAIRTESEAKEAEAKESKSLESEVRGPESTPKTRPGSSVLTPDSETPDAGPQGWIPHPMGTGVEQGEAPPPGTPDKEEPPSEKPKRKR